MGDVEQAARCLVVGSEREDGVDALRRYPLRIN